MVHMNPEIFREYDIRGIAETDLNPEFVVYFGKILAASFREHGETTVLVGRDNRLSSGRVRDDLVAGLIAAGCRVVDIGTVTSPLFYYARILYQVNAGVMITASHNPSEFNGFKITLGSGTIYGPAILKLREMALAGKDATIQRLPVDDSRIERRHPAPDYLAMLTGKIQLGSKPLKVAVDCGNGTASLLAVDFLKSLGCEVLPIFCESDGTFPNHHPDPVKTSNLKDLKDLVLNNRADLGIGFDGDGDRLGVVDNEGRIIWGDQLMILYWREILPKHPGTTCIVEVKCSQSLVEEIERLGGEPIFYKTGHSLIKAKMKEIGAVFTGEMSGHMFFADEFFGFDDAFYAAGRLLRILSHSRQSLAEMLSSVPQYCATAETRVPCTDRDKFQVVAAFRKKFEETNEVIAVDGARVLFPTGWGLVRASNTQPVIVARCEARDEVDLKFIAGLVREKLLSFAEVGDFEWEY